MRLAFIDTVGWQYDAATPYEQPMGGTQSALCYLAVELAKLGHEITVFTGNQERSESLGVTFDNIAHSTQWGYLNRFDVVIVVSAALGRTFRRDIGVTVPLVMWNHHTYAQQAIKDLILPSEQAAWTAIAFVSHDQRKNYVQVFELDEAKTTVMYNGVSPAFEGLPQVISEPPLLFYTSTPFRGLDVLLDAFPAIRKATGAILRVYSSMAVYRLNDVTFEPLYRQARGMDGVDYVGSLGQRALASNLIGAAGLAYPSTFAECHSISALEAMAVGADVFTTDLGGQRETTGGLAHMIPFHGDKVKLAREFADLVIAGLEDTKANPQKAVQRRSHRMAFVRESYLWSIRAKVWEDWLEGVKHQSAAA